MAQTFSGPVQKGVLGKLLKIFQVWENFLRELLQSSLLPKGIEWF